MTWSHLQLVDVDGTTSTRTDPDYGEREQLRIFVRVQTVIE